MATGSIKSQTKSQQRKNRKPKQTAVSDDILIDAPRASKNRVAKSSEQVIEAGEAVSISDRAYLVWSILIIALAAVLRLYLLEMKPLHHDEGVNGFFFTSLFRENVYRYDPANYHGPSLYYLTLPFARAFGLETLALRLTTVVFGVATVWLALHLRRYIGSLGALAAAALISISPGAVYLSRYYIHETLFVFFTLASVVAALHYYESADEEGKYDVRAGVIGVAAAFLLVALALALANYPNTHYSAQMASVLKLSMLTALVVSIAALYVYAGARAIYLILAFMSAAFLFATKETAFISAGVILLATVLAHAFVKIREKSGSSNGRNRKAKKASKSKWGAREETDGVAKRFGEPWQFAIALLIGLGLFLFLNIALYSSFFTNPQGVSDSLSTFAFWTATGKSDFHRKEFSAYIKWLWREEAVLLVLGLIGACFAVWRARRGNRFPLFIAAWAFGILVAYSLVPYKTPWLVLNFIVPLGITSGYAIDVIGRWRAGSSIFAARERYVNLILAAVIMGGALGLGAYQSLLLNFKEYDNDRHPYVYAHTVRETNELVERINQLAARAGTGNETRIAILSPEYWPLPWYLRDYDPNVAFHGRMVTPTNEQILILRDDQARDYGATFADDFQQLGTYVLRPGVNLELYAHRELVTQ